MNNSQEMAGKRDSSNGEATQEASQAGQDSLSQSGLSRKQQMQIEQLQEINTLRETLNADAKALANPDASLVSTLERAGTLVQKRAPNAHVGEQTAGILHQVSEIMKSKTANISVGFNEYHPEVFVTKLKSFKAVPLDLTVEPEEDEDNDDEDQEELLSPGIEVGSPEWWSCIGKSLDSLYGPSTAPHFSWLYGALEVPRKQRAVTIRRKRVDLGAVKTVVASNVEEKGEGAETTDRVREVFSLLRKKGPINLFDFLINPKSYGQTVENFFYFSFLVKEGKASVSVKDNELIVEAKKTSEVAGSATTAQRKQAVMPLEFKAWMEMIEERRITSPIIPTRDYSRGSFGQSSSGSSSQSQRRRWPGGDSSQSASQGPAKRFHSDSSLEGEKFIV